MLLFAFFLDIWEIVGTLLLYVFVPPEWEKSMAPKRCVKNFVRGSVMISDIYDVTVIYELTL